MPNFMLVSLNARFLLKIDLICLARRVYCNNNMYTAVLCVEAQNRDQHSCMLYTIIAGEYTL